jgi:tetratricopeptide (TPR) repeat protein
MLKEYIFYHKARNYLKLGESKIKSNQEFRVELKNALNNINEAIDIGKKNSFKNLMFSYFYKGVILYRDSKYMEALKAFDEQIKLQDDFGNSYVYKAYCYETAPELKDKMSPIEILNLYNKGLINSEGYDWLEKRVKCFKEIPNSNSQIFISYAHKDKLVVHAFTNFLKQCGFNCWIDYEKMQTGDILKETLKKEISNSKIFISFLSPAYGASDACQYEVETAKELKLHILPIIVERPSKLEKDNTFKWLKAANGFDMNKILQIDQQVIYANLVGINASPSEIIKHKKIGELLNVISDKLLS